ncbi:MAG: hypothetical protein ABEK12_02755, partial [Candidatus Nanohaloarchaea archaeon]
VDVFGFDRDERIVGLMDGTGTNLAAVQDRFPLRLIGTSRTGEDVKSRDRAAEWDVPLVEMDIPAYEQERGVEPLDYLRARDPDR